MNKCIKMCSNTVYLLKDENGCEFEITDDMFNYFGSEIDATELIKEKLTYRDKLDILADRFDALSEVINKRYEVIDYECLRRAVITGANEAFIEAKETYMSNQSIYKHIDGTTTVVDVDGFYKSEHDIASCRTMSSALKAVANDIRSFKNGKARAIKGIDDKVYNVEHLYDVSGKDIANLINLDLMPIEIYCRSDRNNVDEKKVVYIHIAYTEHDDMIYDIRKIFKASKELAKLCIIK